MKSFTYAAVAALLSLGVQAVPMAGELGKRHALLHQLHKRAVVWVTETEVVTVTSMITVYPGDESPATLVNKVAIPQANTPPPSTATYYDQPDKEATPTVAAPAPTKQVEEQPQQTQPAVVAPATPSSAAPQPTPEPAVSQPQPESSPAPAPSQAPIAPQPVAPQSAAPAPETYTPPSTGGGSAGPMNGWATFYDVGQGACGWTNSGSEPVVAIGTTLFDQYARGVNPNKNRLCGAIVTIKGPNGVTKDAKIVDRCGACGDSNIDMSTSLFANFAAAEVGKLQGVTWSISGIQS